MKECLTPPNSWHAQSCLQPERFSAKLRLPLDYGSALIVWICKTERFGEKIQPVRSKMGGTIVSVSVGVLAYNSADYIQKLLRAIKGFADEIVIGVDSASTDATEEICGQTADKLFLLEPIGTSERALTWLNEQCTGKLDYPVSIMTSCRGPALSQLYPGSRAITSIRTTGCHDVG